MKKSVAQAFSLLPVPMSETEFRHLAAIISAQLGFRLPDSKQKLLAGRLANRLRELGLDSYQDYADLLTGPDSAEELQHAIELITTNETFFFREPAHFEFLHQHVLPAYQKAGRIPHIWSAACSSGQEAYSIAMVLADSFGLEGSWRVLGSDINERVIKQARQGLYLDRETKNIALDKLKKYCLRGYDEYEGKILIDRRLRQHVQFQQLNLMQPLATDLSGFDVVFLRNIMIYLESGRKDDLVEKIKPCIRSGGFLIVGHTESMSVRVQGFSLVRPSIYMRD